METRFDDLRRDGRMRWLPSERAWSARPDEVVDALVHEGYAEYKREIARNARHPAGGMWQGLNTETGSVASAIWVRRLPADDTIVFIDIDGRSVAEE